MLENNRRTGQEKQRAHIMIYNGNQFLCLSSPSASLALQHGGLLPRESGADPELQIREGPVIQTLR